MQRTGRKNIDMYKIVRGLGVLEKGVPLLFVTATNFKDKEINLGRFILIVGHNEDSEAILLPFKTQIRTKLGYLPRDQFELGVLLEEELLHAKQHYCDWLYKQIGDKAFAQIRHAVWQEINDIIPFALMYYKLNKKACGKIAQITKNAFCCEELKSFIRTVEDLGLTIEKEDG